jgi:NAD(P)-dependent dehydrogenase (short-subunit alcohol dehydrogenase family)
MKLFDLTGKVAIVTGSSRGIGKATAETLAGCGARVVISSRQQDACEVVAAAINARHGEGAAVAVAASISDKAALEHLVRETETRLGPVDILVCNAASNPHFGSLATIDDGLFRKIFDNNVMANHWLIQLVAPGMCERKSGSIIIVSSVAGLHGSAVLGAYGVSKAADFQLARNYAHEYGPSNVRVNCIAPGIIKTDFARAMWEDKAKMAEVTSNVPMRRIGEPDEIAGVAAFLASPASAFMTGQVVVVDGGALI